MKMPQPKSKLLMYTLALGACCDCAGRFFKISSLHAFGETVFFCSIPCIVTVLGVRGTCFRVSKR